MMEDLVRLVSYGGGKTHVESDIANIPMCRTGGQNNRLTKFRRTTGKVTCANCLSYPYVRRAMDAEYPETAPTADESYIAVPTLAEEQARNAAAAPTAAEVAEVAEQPAEAAAPSYAQTITTLARQFRQADEQGTMNLDVRAAIVRAASAAGRAAGIPSHVALFELFDEIEAPAPTGARQVPAFELPAPAPVETRSCAQLVVELAAEAREAEAAGTMTEDARTSIVRRISDAARREGIDPVGAITEWYDLAHAAVAA